MKKYEGGNMNIENLGNQVVVRVAEDWGNRMGFSNCYGISFYGQGLVALKSPYRQDIVDLAKSLGGKWNPGSKSWTMAKESAGELIEKLPHIPGSTLFIQPELAEFIGLVIF